MAKVIPFLIALFFTVNILPVAAQEDLGDPIPACPAEELEEINEDIDFAARTLSGILESTSYDNIIEVLDDIARTQRSFWTAVLFMPHCAEVYTRAYPMGRILDEYTIAYGIVIAAVVEGARDSDSNLAERLPDQADKHLREAQRMIRMHLPELDELLGDEEYQ